MIEHIGKDVVLGTELERLVERGPRYTVKLNGEPFTGISRVMKPSGEPKGDYSYFLGYNDGVKWIYEPNGSLGHISGWFNEQEHGLWRFYKNDQVWKTEKYYLGLRINTTIYFQDGDIEETYSIESDRSSFQEYSRILKINSEKELLIPSVELPIEQAFLEWEKVVLDSLNKG